jgi:hypothetical protein
MTELIVAFLIVLLTPLEQIILTLHMHHLFGDMVAAEIKVILY